MPEPIPFKPPNGKPPGPGERRAICNEALTLARRAQRAGLSMATVLLCLAAFDAGYNYGLFGRAQGGRDFRDTLADDPIPDEPEALIAWAKRHIMDEPG